MIHVKTHMWWLISPAVCRARLASFFVIKIWGAGGGCERAACDETIQSTVGEPSRAHPPLSRYLGDFLLWALENKAPWSYSTIQKRQPCVIFSRRAKCS